MVLTADAKCPRGLNWIIALGERELDFVDSELTVAVRLKKTVVELVSWTSQEIDRGVGSTRDRLPFF